MEEKIVLCGANAYDKKYYFNQKFDKIPDSIKDELHIICVLFTEEVGGIITLAFESDGTLVIETNAADDDFYYDYKPNSSSSSNSNGSSCWFGSNGSSFNIIPF